MFGFGKKKNKEQKKSAPATGVAPARSEQPTVPATEQLAALHNEPRYLSSGPYDQSDGSLRSLLDPKGEGVGIADFGAYAFVAPADAQIQIETTPEGLFDCHILVGSGRVTMSAYSAPKSGGQWRLIAAELAEGLRAQGAHISIQDGPWGREVVGKAPGSTIRFIGTDGSRWMLRSVVVSEDKDSEEMAEIARDIFAKTVVRRGNEPMPVRNPIPLELPADVQMQVQAAQQQAWEEQRIEMERQRLQENS